MVQSADLTDIAECAQRMHFPEQGARVQSFNIYLREVHTDSATFRLNFYTYDGKPLAERAFDSENFCFVVRLTEGGCVSNVGFSVFLIKDMQSK